MKKSLLAFLLLLVLSSCGGVSGGVSASSAATTKPERIACYYIDIRTGSSYTTKQFTYYHWISTLYEYKNESGSVFYSEMNNLEDRPIYAKRNSVESERYPAKRTVGYLSAETNYYLDLSSRVIDIETKWSAYEGEMSSEDAGLDNKEALEKATSGFLASADYSAAKGVFLDMIGPGLVRHTYFAIAADANVTCVEKWF